MDRLIHFLKSIGYHLYCTKVSWTEPLNSGSRAKYLKRWWIWILFYKYWRRRMTIPLENGYKITVYPYPDHDSGEMNIYTKNVDYHCLQFIRNKFKNGIRLVDVGCNVGNRTLALADLIEEAILIDANPICIERCVESLQKNQLLGPNYSILQLAIGDNNQVVRFSDMGGADTCNQIIDATNVSTPSILVKMKRLDDLESSRNFKPNFIKIDTEGYDLKVLIGSERLLRSGCVELVMFEKSRNEPLNPFIAFFDGIGWVVFIIGDDGNINFDFEQYDGLNYLAAPKIGL